MLQVVVVWNIQTVTVTRNTISNFFVFFVSNFSKDELSNCTRRDNNNLLHYLFLFVEI